MIHRGTSFIMGCYVLQKYGVGNQPKEPFTNYIMHLRAFFDPPTPRHI